MALFESSEKFLEVLGGFFQLMADTPLIADKLLKSKLIARFNYSDPDVVLVVDCSGDKVEVRAGDLETKSIIELKMNGDIAHKFWFGKVNLLTALTTRKIVAKGPIPKILKLLPTIQPLYKMYPELLRKWGKDELVIY